MDILPDYELFVQLHSLQLKQSAVPEWFWPSIFTKLKSECFDAGENFMMGRMDDGELTVIMTSADGLDYQRPSSIFLVDHAWTFQERDAPLQLKSVPGLLPRISALIGLNDGSVDEVFRAMWKYMRPYSRIIDSKEPAVTFWYIMDEFGSAIRHSSDPNFRAVPFFYQTEEIAYTLLFPVRDIEENEQVFIDYVEGVGQNDSKARDALLVPWTGSKFIEESYEFIEPDDNFFLSGALREKLPNEFIKMPSMPSSLRVYSDYHLIREYLKAPGFVIVGNEEDADVLWLTKHFDDYKGLAESHPGTFINQFPCERVITTKDLLSIVALRIGNPKWLPLTFNLMTELPAFVSTFQKRMTQGLDNHWICKPWNLARALETTVTDNLDCILRLPFSGPKIAQKYAETPVLFNRENIGRVKFDIRYVILLESIEPLKIYCYKQFFLRFANKCFDLKDLWDYEKHFTVMNYRGDSRLHRMLCDEFKDEFELQYPDQSWGSIEDSILTAVKEVFTAAAMVPPPRGIAHFSQSRALYAADFVLVWEQDKIQPWLLEINFGPDCERACQYYPDFYDDIFNLLFKNQIETSKFHVL